MKRFIACFVVFLIVVAACFALKKPGGQKVPEIIRVHIRANSNSQEDQAIKFKVKDRVSEFLSGKLLDITDLDAALEVVNSNLNSIDKLAEAELSAGGFSYKAKSSLRVETFPTRVYEGITFESGDYRSLIIELGEGQGDNWWCIMYPPLCFLPCDTTTEQKLEYKSWIMELLNQLKGGS